MTNLTEEYVNTPEMRPGCVCQEVYELNTLMGNTSELLTNSFNGLLKGFIIDSNQQVHISIVTEEGLVVYENLQYYGHSFVPVRFQGISTGAELLNFSSVEFPINDKLHISIEGSLNTIVKVTVRYC